MAFAKGRRTRNHAADDADGWSRDLFEIVMPQILPFQITLRRLEPEIRHADPIGQVDAEGVTRRTVKCQTHRPVPGGNAQPVALDQQGILQPCVDVVAIVGAGENRDRSPVSSAYPQTPRMPACDIIDSVTPASWLRASRRVSASAPCSA